MYHHLSALQSALECVPPTLMKNCILLGDFNVDLLDPSSSLFSDLTAATSSFHLSQIVTEPTRITDTAATLIDHVYVTDPTSVVTCITTPPLLNSDHMCICIGLRYRSPLLRALPRRVWKYGAADFEGANEALSSALPNSTSDNVNLSWNTFKSVFLTTMLTYIPNKVVAVRRSLPWLN